MNIRAVLTLIAVALILITPSSAYIVPAEYRSTPYLSDYDIYLISKNHLDQPWAYDNLRGLMIQYTNSGRCMPCLDAYMEYVAGIMEKKVRKVPKFPGLPGIH